MKEQIIHTIEIQLKELEFEERLIRKRLSILKQRLTRVQEGQKAARKALLELKEA